MSIFIIFCIKKATLRRLQHYSLKEVVVCVVQQLPVQGGIKRAGEVDQSAGGGHGHHSGDHPAHVTDSAPPQHSDPNDHPAPAPGVRV